MAAGVSIGTASDALNGKGRMSEEVRQRVIDTAEAIGYRPNANARILALGRSEIVALVTHGPAGSGAPRVYWPQLQAAFTERLLDHGMVAATMTLDVNDINAMRGTGAFSLRFDANDAITLSGMTEGVDYTVTTDGTDTIYTFA